MAGLETTATLDKNTDEWVIHTPNIKATKFWPGTVGLQATHSVVFARLIVDENDYGVQPFMVQLRSLKDHKPLPGIEVGDVGEKLGYDMMDNAYVSFNQVRIPRTDMLSRFAEVDKEGNFELKGDPRMVYQIMVQTRLLIIFGANYMILHSSRIATRYAVCRRQFRTIEGKSEERQLIDYQTHMNILGPILCTGLVIGFAGQLITKLNIKSTEKIDEQNDFRLLDVLHHFTAGVKAFATE